MNEESYYSLSGCSKIICTRPSPTIVKWYDFYSVVETNLDLSAGPFVVSNIKCINRGKDDAVVGSPCKTSGPYNVSGCSGEEGIDEYVDPVLFAGSPDAAVLKSSGSPGPGFFDLGSLGGDSESGSTSS